ncbi:MAG: ribosome silencing factor [Magnetococcales bacterium]|nr:ribosome silencing factor [Magnetococcales bacterium]
MQSSNLADALERLLDDKKGEEIVRIDLRGRSPFTDFFLIVTGTSRTHLRAMAMEVDRLASQTGIQELGIAGMEAGEWVLIDLGDVVVHLFLRETRAFYNLERLWSPESLDPGERPAWVATLRPGERPAAAMLEGGTT